MNTSKQIEIVNEQKIDFSTSFPLVEMLLKKKKKCCHKYKKSKRCKSCPMNC